jgi:hypothetical protein
LIGRKTHPWALNDEQKAIVENSLKPSICGGQFRFGALPKCPNCNSILKQLLRDNIHYVQITNVLDGDKVEIWKDKLSSAD